MLLPMLLIFQMSLLSFDNGWTYRNVDCCVNTVDRKYYGYKFGELWYSNHLDFVAYLHGW